jgi:hypothetical protein
MALRIPTFSGAKAMEYPQYANPWEYTLELLTQMSTPSRAANGHTRSLGNVAKFLALTNRRNLANRKQVAHLHIVDKSSDSEITVCWRDATFGCYGEQIWKRVLSRTHTTCALSGLQIRRGDAVFRPWARGCKPVNVGLMILASAVAAPTEYACASCLMSPCLS